MKKLYETLVLCTVILFPSIAKCQIVNMQDSTGTWRLERFITTHFISFSGDDSIGGIREQGVEVPYYGSHADDRWMNEDKAGQPWEHGIKPSYNNYHNQTTAYNALMVTCDNDTNGNSVADEIEEYQRVVFDSTGYHIDILNWNPNEPLDGYLLEEHDNIQIVNNIRHGNSLFTVIFPPQWTTKKSLPILLTGNGFDADNNTMYSKNDNTTYSKEDIKYPLYVGRSLTWGDGLIVVKSNCGGRESLGINTNAMNDIVSFLVNVISNYGGDTNRIATQGSSRAGNTALVWGANPLGFGYNVVSIHAFAPPVKIGSSLPLAIETFPSLIGAIKKALGSQSAYLNAYEDENTALPMTRMNKARAIANVFLGTSSLEEADQKSAYGYYSDRALRQSLQSKRISISQGTHDSFLPMPHFIAFDELLTDNDIPHTTHIGYVRGHDFHESQYDDFFTIKNLVSRNSIDPYNGGRKFYMPGKLVRVRNGTERQGSVTISDSLIAEIKSRRESYFASDHDATKLAFSAAIPYRVGKGDTATITLIGEQGKSWEIRARKEKGYYTVYEGSGTFGESISELGQVYEHGNEYIILNCSFPDTGSYEWFFTYDGLEVPNRFTPYLLPGGAPAKAVTVVTNSQPNTPEDYWYEAKKSQGLNFGVDQYHPLLLEGNSDPEFQNLRNLTRRAGNPVKFKVRAKDSVGDKLVYDVRDQNNHLINGIEFSGLTGEFYWQTSSEDVGTHKLKAIASDGKFGRAEKEITITINE